MTGDPTWLQQNRVFKIVELQSPIMENGQPIKSLRIRQPCVIDLEQVPAESMQRPIELLRIVLARCAEVSDTAIRTLTIVDMTTCTRALTEMGFTIADAYLLLDAQSQSLPTTGQTGSA
jgi:hypothetical protein